MKTSDSFTKFGTICFGLEYMKSMIYRSPEGFEAARWFHFVPECYRPDVFKIAQRVLANFAGIPVTKEVLDQIVTQLCAEIHEKIEPVRP